MDDCTFCRIIAGDEKGAVLYEDEAVIAILDKRPATEGHTLVIPRDHVTEFLSDPETATAVSTAVSRIVQRIDETLEPDGFSIFHTTGSLVGTVDHAHLHLVPRYEDDEVALALPRSRLATGTADRLVEAVSDSDH